MIAEVFETRRGNEPVGDAMRRVFGEAGFAVLDIPKRGEFPRNPFETPPQ